MLGAATRLPAAETGRRGWGRVLIFQGPVKGLRKNQQTQLVRAAHLSYSFCRNVCQESSACRSTVCRASVGRYQTGTMYVRAIRKKQRQGSIVAMVSCLLLYGIKFALCELGRPPVWRHWGQSLRTQEKGQALTYRGVLFLAGVIYSAQQIGIYKGEY